ncbi:transposase [Salinimicrobium flavum]|uniref:Transposase n=1 Tax=Salinimicrobium flavum TaxID=1737065 RepID=A0ABW5IVX7_9FLAO
MADRFKNKYRIKSARLENWDYRWNAAYFITICTAHRKHYFGEIIKGKMEFSPVGIIADIMWHEITHHTSHVQLGAFVVMPNHIHGILILNNPEIPIEDNENGNDLKNKEGKEKDEKEKDGKEKDGKENVQTLHATSPQSPQDLQNPPKNPQMAKISPKANSISTIIRSYKSATTKHAHRLGYEFEWQTRFHDHIIRNDISYYNISNYIKNNPVNWKEDNFH